MAVSVSSVRRERFHIPLGSCLFQSQFAGIYLARLKSSKSRLLKLASNRWPKLAVRSLADVESDEECIIVGTTFRSCPQKPSIIKQLAQMEQIGGQILFESQNNQQSLSSRLAGVEDAFFLEDEVQLISLDIQSRDLFERLTTGVVACIMGIGSKSLGSFTVKEAAFIEPQPLKPISAVNCLAASHLRFDTGLWVAFVSGLGFTASAEGGCHGHELALSLLGDFLRENKLRRLFVLGDCIRASAPGGLETLGVIQQARFLTRKADADSVLAMSALDTWLSNLPLGDGFTVQLQPGVSDCVSQLLPQQPFHSLLFPKTVSRFGKGEDALISATNPCITDVFARSILTSSGQNISDVYKYTSSGDMLDCMESILHWGHLAPTCPDTIFSYPQTESDSLLLHTDPDTGSSADYPDIFVAGNQSKACFRRASLKAGSSDREGALLISVPRFDVSFTFVLLELESLRCLPVKFDLSQIK
nr:dna polymerase subunit delta,dna polymerase delta subunit [Hymenolepis microstoma]